MQDCSISSALAILQCCNQPSICLWYSDLSSAPSNLMELIMSDSVPAGQDNITRADSRLALSQWETSLQCNAVSHWLGANLESVLITMLKYFPDDWGLPYSVYSKVFLWVSMRFHKKMNPRYGNNVFGKDLPDDLGSAWYAIKWRTRFRCEVFLTLSNASQELLTWLKFLVILWFDTSRISHIAGSICWIELVSLVGFHCH